MLKTVLLEKQEGVVVFRLVHIRNMTTSCSVPYHFHGRTSEKSGFIVNLESYFKFKKRLKKLLMEFD
jgi:hypothetical protein